MPGWTKISKVMIITTTIIIGCVIFLLLSLSFKRTNEPISTFMIQIAVLANHQNGRDTHMRQIKVFTPVEESSIGKFPRCTTVDFMMYRTIRWFVSTQGSFLQSPRPANFRKLHKVCSNQRIMAQDDLCSCWNLIYLDVMQISSDM